jgi:hypothetical protein
MPLTKHVIHTAVRRKNDKSYPYSGYGYSFPANILRTVEGFSGNTVGIDSRCHIFHQSRCKTGEYASTSFGHGFYSG